MTDCDTCKKVKTMLQLYIKVSVLGLLTLKCRECGTIWALDDPSQEPYILPDWPTQEQRQAKIDRRVANIGRDRERGKKHG